MRGNKVVRVRRKHVPIRTCIGCRSPKPKKELLRIVRTPQGSVEIDETGRQSGRGAYICRSQECLEKAVKGRHVEKALKCRISQELYDELKRAFHE
ncbi:MAG: YlxR family protein [Firmicutes bacterium]|nr:YlxR family protein [Bacillota bacterium]